MGPAKKWLLFFTVVFVLCTIFRCIHEPRLPNERNIKYHAVAIERYHYLTAEKDLSWPEYFSEHQRKKDNLSSLRAAGPWLGQARFWADAVDPGPAGLRSDACRPTCPGTAPVPRSRQSRRRPVGESSRAESATRASRRAQGAFGEWWTEGALFPTPRAGLPASQPW